MAITLETAARNAACNAIVDLVDGGSGDATGDFLFRASTTSIVTINTAATAFGDAETGAATLAGTPLTGTAVAGGTVDNFQVRNKANTVIFSGSCTATGGGGNITFNNADIANTQVVNLTSFTLTVP